MQDSRIEILLIEDNPAEAGLIKEMLAEARQHQELSVQHVQSLEAGLSLLRSRNFDVVLTDLGLPDSQGLETALAVRDEAKRAPVIVLTILDDEESAVKSLQMDIQDYLIKGEINGNQLLRSIRYAIQRKRISEELRESEQRFASFMLNLPAAAWMKDMEGRYVYANAEAERVFSMPLSSLLGKTDMELFPPETARQFGENDCRVLAQGGSLQTTEVLRQADGIDHHSIVNKFAVNGPEGKPAYVAGVAFDITEQKRLEADLEHFASFPLINPTPIMEMDCDGKVTFCNHAAETMLGKVECLASSNPLIPKNLPDILCDLHQEEVRQYRGTVEVGEQVFDELIYLAPKFNSVRIYAMDITERRRLEEDRSRLAAIVENSDDAIFAKTLDGIIVDWNKGAEKLFGYTAAEIKGRHVSTLLPADRSDEVSRIFEKIGRAEFAEHFETVRVTKDGRYIPISLSISPIKDTDGRITGASAIARDITERKRAEEALRLSEERYRALFRDNPTMIVTLDAEWTMLSVNPFCASQLGYTIEELEGQSVLKIFHEDDRPAVIEQLRKCLQNPNKVFRWQFRKARKDGGLLWVEEIAQAVHDLNGTLNILVVCQDITERKRAEEELRKSERKFLKIFHAAPALIGISSLAEGRFIDVNEMALETLGYRREEVIGRTAHELGLWENEADRARMLEELQERGSVRNLEISARGKSGRPFVGLYSAEIIEINGDRYLLSLVRDITARKQAEEALMRAKEEWERTFDSVPDLIAILDDRNRIVRVNRAMGEQIGLPPEKCVGLICYTAIHGTDSPPEYCPHARTLADGRGHSAEMHEGFLAGDFLVTTTPLLGPDGKMTGVVHMARDITERKRMEEEIIKLNTDLAMRAAELESANKELEAFNYTVAHDLRRPLTNINGYCQIMQELCGEKLDDTCMGYLREAYNGTLRMNQLISALLNFSTMAGIKLRRETVDFSKLAHEIALDLQMAEPGRKVELRLAEGVTVNGDPELLRLVMENLLGNSWKYTARQENALIEFGVTQIAGETVYFVRDNGPGFALADAEKLFIPFTRLPGAEECKGFGIGLATVKRIIHRHEGRIWAEGEPGKGATFFFTLPAEP